MKKLVVSEDTNIVLNNENFLLESGDIISVNQDEIDEWLLRMRDAVSKGPEAMKILLSEMDDETKEVIYKTLKEMQASLG